MPIEITVPRLGWTMEEGTFVGWLKKHGELVRAGDPLFSLEGDKALQEVEATDSGILQIPADAPAAGSVVRVGAVLGYLAGGSETAAAAAAPKVTAAVISPTVEKTAALPEPRRLPEPAARPRPPISPRALKTAAALGVDLEKIVPTGRAGRIRERDVIAAAGRRPEAAVRPKVPFSLLDKVAIVTGAASGIGAAIAQAFAEAGAIVYVADINESDGAQHAAGLREAGGRVEAAVLNVAEQASCEALITRVLHEQGRCDILVNNAGVGHVGTILTTPPEELERLWSINVRGMYYLCRAVLPSMLASQRGAIINMASALGLIAMEDRFAYTVTKHAVVGLTRSMAFDLGTTGVRINCICPGRVETPFVQARLAEYPDPEKFRAQMVSSHAQKRMAQPWEIASAAVYLASDESAFMTGSTFVIDGGYLCGK